MAYAPNLTESLFKAIEERYGQAADMLQLGGNIHWDLLPPGEQDRVPRVVVTQGEEAGATELAVSSAGMDSAGEMFAINFDAYAKTMSQASQIGWQLAELFTGWESADGYDGIEIRSTERSAPPWTGQTEQGVCQSSVSFMVSCAVREEE